MAKRLSNEEKINIAEEFRNGNNTSLLSKKYRCTVSTIVRTIKNILTEDEYDLLRRNNKNKKIIKASKDLNVKKKEESDIPAELNDDINFEQFSEIAPLTEEIDFENKEQNVAVTSLNDCVLPDVVFMIVDKKIELDPKLIAELPEWSFLPDSEKERKVLYLYPNQRNAKRNCTRNQKVIKIPDSKIFLLTVQSLLAKGITRLIIDDLLVQLD